MSLFSSVLADGGRAWTCAELCRSLQPLYLHLVKVREGDLEVGFLVADQEGEVARIVEEWILDLLDDLVVGVLSARDTQTASVDRVGLDQGVYHAPGRVHAIAVGAAVAWPDHGYEARLLSCELRKRKGFPDRLRHVRRLDSLPFGPEKAGCQRVGPLGLVRQRGVIERLLGGGGCAATRLWLGIGTGTCFTCHDCHQDDQERTDPIHAAPGFCPRSNADVTRCSELRNEDAFF